MAIRKEISEDNELYLWMNGNLIYKRWLNDGYSKIFDRLTFESYSNHSITDLDLEETPELIHVTTKLKLLSTDQGGRATGIVSGYRPNHVFEYRENGDFLATYIGDIQFDDVETILPGEEKMVTVRFLAQQPIDKYLNIGRKWWIHEGPNVIGEAEMLKITLPKQ